jgi:pimeloyl-ACP methyl ester carboxylesterase
MESAMPTFKHSIRANWRLRIVESLGLWIVSPFLLNWNCASAEEVKRIQISSGVEIAYTKTGHGPVPIVFVSGYSLSHETWKRVIPLFPPDRYTLYAYDLRGFGQSSKPADGFSMHQHAIDLHDFITALNVSRAVVIGHSIGGSIAQEFGILYPERTIALVSSGGAARYLPLSGWSEALAQRVAGYGTVEQNRKIFEANVPRYFDPRNVTASDINETVRIALQSSTTALKDQLRDSFVAAPLPEPAFRAIKFPVLAVAATTDMISPISQAILLTDIIPDSEIAIVERSGHSPMWERPPAWAEKVLDFLARRVK